MDPAEPASDRKVEDVLEWNDGCFSMLVRLLLYFVFTALFVLKVLSLQNKHYRFIQAFIDVAREVPWPVVMLGAPIILSLTLRDEPANQRYLGVPILPIARFCEAWTRVAIWLTCFLFVLSGLFLAYLLIANATVLGVLIVIAILLAILVTNQIIRR